MQKTRTNKNKTKGIIISTVLSHLLFSPAAPVWFVRGRGGRGGSTTPADRVTWCRRGGSRSVRGEHDEEQLHKNQERSEDR